jgi:hypothetical protein
MRMTSCAPSAAECTRWRCDGMSALMVNLNHRERPVAHRRAQPAHASDCRHPSSRDSQCWRFCWQMNQEHARAVEHPIVVGGTGSEPLLSALFTTLSPIVLMLLSHRQTDEPAGSLAQRIRARTGGTCCHHRRRASTAQMPSTTPNGHVPASHPYTDDAAQASANTSLHPFARGSIA